MKQDRPLPRSVIARTEVTKVAPPLPRTERFVIYVGLWLLVTAFALLCVGGAIWWSERIAGWIPR